MNSFTNEASKTMNKSMDYVKNMSGDTLQQGKHELKKSGQDWVEYVQEHPIQSMLFGVVAYFAIKGMMKD